MDFGNHSSTKTCQIFGTIYSINFQSQNQTLKDRKVEDEVEMVQEMDAVEDIEYDLVEDAEEESDYKSDFDSEEEDSNDIFDKIAKY